MEYLRRIPFEHHPTALAIIIRTTIEAPLLARARPLVGCNEYTTVLHTQVSPTLEIRIHRFQAHIVFLVIELPDAEEIMFADVCAPVTNSNQKLGTAKRTRLIKRY